MNRFVSGVAEMDVYASSDEDYHYDSDHEDSVEAYENDENYALLSSKGTTTKVYDTPFWGYPNFYSFSFFSCKKPSLVGFLSRDDFRPCFFLFLYCIG